MLLTNIGNLLKQKRVNIGLTQFEIAEKANIDEKHYGRIERNECINIKLLTFIQICNALEAQPVQLLAEILDVNNL